LATKARILAIDDQLYFRSFLDGLLSEEGFEVSTAASAPEAMEILAEGGPFDLVIMDMVMPDTDGVDMVARIRRDWPELAIVVVSGVGEVRSVVAAMKEGAADYLLKPIDREGLVQSVEAVLGQRRARAETARLVDENLQFMGRLSLLERALPLVGDTNLDSACEVILDLLCSAAGAESGVLWVQQEPGGPLVRQSSRSESDDTESLADWAPETEELAGALASGRPALRPLEGGGEDTRVLFVPALRDDEMVAVARLEAAAASEFGMPEIEACATVAGISAIVVTNARRELALGRTAPILPAEEPEAVEASAAPTADDVELLRDPTTRLPSRAFFEEALQIEINKAHRYGRRLACLCIDLAGEEDDPARLAELVTVMTRTLRTTDVLASEEGRRFWVLVSETDPLGGIVLKRRLAERVRSVMGSGGSRLDVALGVASYPVDGEKRGELLAEAVRRVEVERSSLIYQMDLPPDAPLAEVCERLLTHAKPMPGDFVAETADLLIGELSHRPKDRGLVFLAPGSDGAPLMAPLHALGDAETATEVFLATDGDTVPSAPAVTAVALPPDTRLDTTWIVRFGEAPPYALVAGPAAEGGMRPVFHTNDPGLVEHMAFRLRSEVGFGVRTGCGF
jgi:DNA-binding response OmpR family regulator/GGDEF domain-containing protein